MNHKVSIYCLIDPRNGEVRYVGKTKNRLSKRLYAHIKETKKCLNEHKSMSTNQRWISELLKKNKKPKIELIELVDSSVWQEKEIFYIKEYRKKYNLTNTSDGGTSSNPVNKRKIAKIDFLSLKVLNIYESIADIEIKEGISYTRIIDACSGRKMVVSGYLWNYIDEHGSPQMPIYKYKRKKIGKLDLKMNLIEVFPNYQSTGFDPAAISNVCLGRTKISNGFLWRHLDVDNNIIEPNIAYKMKTVSKIDKNGEILEIYENSNQAALANNAWDDPIRRAIKNKKEYRGYYWKYNDY